MREVWLIARRLVLTVVTFCLIASPSSAQILTLMPLENPTIGKGPFLEGCMNLSVWPSQVASKAALLGGASWMVDSLTDAEQQACFAQMNAAGIKLALEVGVLKEMIPPCNTGSGCFWGAKGTFDKMISNGAQIGAFFLDEPLTAIHKGWAPGDFWYGLNETRTYMGLLRTYYPGALIVPIEAYPFLDASEINMWVYYLATGPNRPDFFELDTDFSTSLNPAQIQALMNNTRAMGLGFSLLYSHSGSSPMNETFWMGTDYECSYYLYYGVNADLYHVSAFYNSPPSTALPVGYPYSFVNTTQHLLDRGCINGTPHQPPQGGDQPTFYGDINFSGGSFQRSTSWEFVGWDWNDRISSVHVPAGMTVTLHEHDQFNGQTLVLTSDASDLRAFSGPGADGTWNDAASSITIGGSGGGGGNPTGRWKISGSTCYWDPNDSGPDQCQPPAAEPVASNEQTTPGMRAIGRLKDAIVAMFRRTDHARAAQR